MNDIDILIYMSDQHTASISGFMGDQIVRTPNLDRLANEGTVFDHAYTSCPLCVPSRTSFLTGQLPSRMCVFNNSTSFPADQPTFVHSVATKGYETVLCGRMHFIGPDQRHGFSKRYVGDICHPYWGNGPLDNSDYGEFGRSFAAKYCLDIIGKGDSPVLAYDRDVVESVLGYLKQDHHGPQLIVTGTYAPHFPYMAPAELVDYYYDKMTTPTVGLDSLNYDLDFIKHKFETASEDMLKVLKATYYAMIEIMDAQIGKVRAAWEEYLKRNNRKGVFIYLSDHGDQLGERQLYGKQTFFEYSSRIPCIIQGENIPQGKRVDGLVSIMDIGPTICALVGAKIPPQQAGVSLVDTIINGASLNNRVVLSEYMEKDCDGNKTPSFMVRKNDWKLISYKSNSDIDLLFNLKNDADEINNLADTYPEVVMELKKHINSNWDIEQFKNNEKIKESHLELMQEWGSIRNLDDDNFWKVPKNLRSAPKDSIIKDRSIY